MEPKPDLRRVRGQLMQLSGWVAALFGHLAAHAGPKGVRWRALAAPVPGPGAGHGRRLAAGPVHQLTIGGDPVGRLPVAVPRTISAAGQLRRSARPPDILRQASDLLLALAAVECHVSVGGPGRVPPALLRDLVIITAGLAGHTWLEARADSVAAFTELQASWQSPPLAELDHILARVLSDRFGLLPPAAAA